MTARPSDRLTAPGATLRVPALLWALLHAPVILLLYRASMGIALAPLTPGYAAGMVLAWVLEACYLAMVAFLVGLAFSRNARVYRWAAPAILAFFLVALAVDSRLYEALAFHINALIVRVVFQPGALAQIGIPAGQFAMFVVTVVVLVALDIAAGAWFLSRFGARQWRWRYLLLLLLVPVSERLFLATMQFTGGRVLFAAGDVLPLQIPFRMHQFLGRLTGRPESNANEPLALAGALTPTPALSADSVRFTRRPDIVLVLVESLRSDFFSDSVMPRLWRRGGRGARMDHHIASASSTHYTMFSIVYGQNAQKLESIVGTGRAPIVFGSLRRAGYHMRLITASSVDWMGMKTTVFKDVANDLDTDLPPLALPADSAMVARATDWVARADTAPVFLMLFFGASHFNYSYPPRSHRFVPDWDGVGSITAARVDPVLMKRRAMNSAFEVDWKLDEFLESFARLRGHAPLTIVTGDHGEAFREHGRVGHGAGVAEEEIHVPMVVVDDSVAPSVVTRVTGHVDIVPTILHLLGDRHDPASYSDGVVMMNPPPGRFVVSTAGWIPRFAVVGDSLKAQFFGLDAGFGTVTVTDPADNPLPNSSAVLHANAAAILRALRR